jgi:HD-like signal output (HDOD) protein
MNIPDDDTTPARTPETDKLLDELANSRDFPALSQVITQINQIIARDDSHADRLTDTILKDISLTNKLLRVVNAAHFGQFGSQPVSTISRAVVILGFDTVRDLALSLMLFEHLKNNAQAAELRSEAIESFYCGVIGRMLARKLGHREAEEVFISAMFRNLGRLLARLYFYERSEQVQELMEEEALSEAAASRRVLGMSYDEIGMSVGHLWHLPTTLLEGMSPLPDDALKAPGKTTNRNQLLANLARDLYVSVRDTPQEDWDAVVANVAKAYAKTVELPHTAAVELLYQAGKTAEKEIAIMQEDARKSPLLHKLVQPRPSEAEAEADGGSSTETDTDEAGTEEGAEPTTGDPNAILIEGMQEITGMLLENAHPSALLQVLSELLYRSECFDNVIICTLDPGGKVMAGRFGHGRQAGRLRQVFRIPLSYAPDVFHAVIDKGVDVMISDTKADNIRSRIPDWYVRQAGARSFMLLPMTLAKKTIALVYADRSSGEMKISPQTMGLIKSLRNQTLLALRQRSQDA